MWHAFMGGWVRRREKTPATAEQLLHSRGMVVGLLADQGPLHLKKGQIVGIVKVSSVSTWSIVVPQSFTSVLLRTKAFTNVPLSRERLQFKLPFLF